MNTPVSPSSSPPIAAASASAVESSTAVATIGTVVLLEEASAVATDNARVTKADNGSASATKAAAASSVGDNGNDTRAPKLSICRFLVTDLQAGGGYAKNNYRIDLDKSKHGHGLYDIILLIYDTLQK